MSKQGILFNIQKFCTDDGPGIRTTVFFKGCPLRCIWCANPESQQMQPQPLGDETSGKAYTVQEVMEVVMQDKPFYDGSGGGLTLSGGEPFLQPEFAHALLAAAKAEGLHTAVETTGHVAPDAFASMLPLVDLFLYDVKHTDPARHKAATGVDNQRILQNLRTATLANDVLVRIPVIPGINDTTGDAIAFAKTLLDCGVQNVQLLPFHQFGERKYELLAIPYAMQDVPALRHEDLAAFGNILLQQGLSCRW